ncbi:MULTISPECIES: hypothetical protein [unclassified Methylibium]|uniref:hypothetical protein n=1 Tax=unclassified Methylibium TaxID=2633235 RepID=UPI0012696B3C|nr:MULTISPECIES: hypothetical protein [unclassified Methylibium]
MKLRPPMECAMTLTNWLLLMGAALALAALSWLMCAWWYRRQLSAVLQRLEKARAVAGQNATQAKRQIAQLQKELAERPALSAVQREARDKAADAAARKQELAENLDRGRLATALPANGFADTQPL